MVDDVVGIPVVDDWLFNHERLEAAGIRALDDSVEGDYCDAPVGCSQS